VFYALRVKKGDSNWGVKRVKVILVMNNVYTAASFKLSVTTIKDNLLASFDKTNIHIL